MDTLKIALRIRAFRKLKGLTQLELAERMGVSVSVLGSLERGTRKVDGKLIRRIAEVLDVKEEELLDVGQERRA
ncbi:helix-turn-helix domain-containing protein [Gorillibacterium timonense]|uniref:helix-turn-helix domain-containing protein n=1 Tax=Gorillibacterium timonense TaxID=1689269 RepID=UPI00071C8040|nr:helix-turn-helix transcriptional regulator [Gorillibacterium timonense]